jgi:hypothetical protein
MVDRVLDVLRNERNRNATVLEKIKNGELTSTPEEITKREAEIADLDAKIASHQERMNAARS